MLEVVATGAAAMVEATDGGGGCHRRQWRRSELKSGVFMAVLRLPVVGLKTLLSMVVLGALVVAFEAWVGYLVQFVIVCVVQET